MTGLIYMTKAIIVIIVCDLLKDITSVGICNHTSTNGTNKRVLIISFLINDFSISHIP